MKQYNPHEIEAKWQKYWEKNQVFKVKEDKKKEKFYALIEFPYPSGAGLHVGHPRSYTAMDIIARKKRMDGYNVLYPIGFDAFGLPTENYAIKTGRPPAEVTEENIATFTKQLKMLGFSFDWSRVVDTTDPAYYKWTQWIFLQFFKHGLAYKKNMPINWCLSCKIGLANEEVVDGHCERCGGNVEKRDKEQWMLAITKYADKLLQGLNTVEYIPQAKTQQENWIGKSEGINFKHKVKGMDLEFEVYDSIPQTFLAQTFVVIAPEHPYVIKLVKGTKYEKPVMEFVDKIKKKKMGGKFDIEKDIEGIFTGRYSENYVGTGIDLPIWVASFALVDYGTGIVGCSAHDERDWKFAKKYDLPLKPVLFPKDKELAKKVKDLEVFYREPDGILQEPKELGGMRWDEAREKIIKYIEEKSLGKRTTNYKLRDWVFSRQRYWGEPIPLVYCKKCVDKKQKALIIHGLTGRGDKNWMPFMKEQLEKIGFEVFVPTMTTADHPVLEKWIKELFPIVKDFGANDVIIGHSLGGNAALHLIERLNKKIGHLFLVAPAVGERTEEEWEQKKSKKPYKDYDLARKFWETPIAWKKIINKIDSADVIYSDDDESVKPYNHGFWPKNWKITHAGAYEHFVDHGYDVLFDIIKTSRFTGWVPLSEEELPLKLPKVKKYEPTDTGESPLAAIKDWVNTKCPVCGSPAVRETDTMPNWAGSSWYFLRYCDAKNNKVFAGKDKLDYWTPVDWYNGGMEHTVLHLLYSRFWHQFLHDIGEVPCPEPYAKRTSHGMILAKGGEKMSKSKGNVVNPDEMVEKYGADALRAYIMFMGPFDQAVEWDTNGLIGIKRFLEKVWGLQAIVKDRSDKKENETLFHQTIKKVGEDIEKMRFNTALAKLMELVNEMMRRRQVLKKDYLILVKLLYPFAPHICEELWSLMGKKKSLTFDPWPEYDPEKTIADTIILVVQVNGKIRASIEVCADIDEVAAKKIALENSQVQKWFEGKEPKKLIYVPGKLVSIVV